MSFDWPAGQVSGALSAGALRDWVCQRSNLAIPYAELLEITAEASNSKE